MEMVFLEAAGVSSGADALALFWSAAWPKLLEIGKLLIAAVLIWIIGKKVIKFALKIAKRALERGKVDGGVQSFLMSMLRIVLHGVLVVILAGTVGIETGSIIALLGSAGLAIGLALQGSLSNFAGGVLILILKPFKIGDYIVANGMEGVVTGIDIFYTKLCTTDNCVVVIPNGSLSNSNIKNVTKEPLRRVDLIASVAYESDIKLVKRLLFELASGVEYLVEDEAHPVQVYVDAYGESAINLGLRFWTKTENYWSAKWEATEKMKEVFDRNQISIPYNQLDVMIKK